MTLERPMPLSGPQLPHLYQEPSHGSQSLEGTRICWVVLAPRFCCCGHYHELNSQGRPTALLKFMPVIISRFPKKTGQKVCGGSLAARAHLGSRSESQCLPPETPRVFSYYAESQPQQDLCGYQRAPRFTPRTLRQMTGQHALRGSCKPHK